MGLILYSIGLNVLLLNRFILVFSRRKSKNFTESFWFLPFFFILDFYLPMFYKNLTNPWWMKYGWCIMLKPYPKETNKAGQGSAQATEKGV